MTTATLARDPHAQQIENLLNASMAALGYVIVLARFIGGQNRPTLQLMIEHQDGRGITLDECAELSRLASAIIDVEDAIKTAYVLEVSSPGIDRPLVSWDDFQKYSGQNAKIELYHTIDGRKRFNGLLQKSAPDTVGIEQDGVIVSLPFADIAQARLAVADQVLAPQPKKQINNKKTSQS